ncbi:YdbL family protein [Desulfogranum marinum]|uniref:YdbL family protein n=1 Tax=Desulfogranum marinum TaxID=453220 RepID=UPI0029C7D74F|nr:YdbL family protein [Desulfogranum marinum]
MKKFVAVIFITVFVALSSALALDLQSAKSQGLVGETPSGYLAPVEGGNAEAVKLVQSINAQRKAHYQGIANRNKTSLQSVELLAGKKAIEKSPAGHFVQINGQWKKK